MKKIFKRTTATVIALVLMLSVFSLTGLAAGSSSVAFSKKNLAVGETLTVTVTVSGEEMFGVSAVVSYDAAILQFISGGDSAVGGSGAVTIIGTKQSYALTFKTIAAGSSAVSVSGEYVPAGEGAVETAFAGSAATVTVADAALPANANLKALSLKSGSATVALSPSFSASKTSYSASVPFDTTTCAVTATAADGAAKVDVGGSNDLKVGKNTRTVTVTAQSGATKTYTISITRRAQGEEEPASSEAPAETDENLYRATIAGEEYTILSDPAKITPFLGFSLSTAVYNDTEVPVITDGKGEFILFYLIKDGEESYKPYTFDEAEETFIPLRYAEYVGKPYILLDAVEEETAPDGYFKTLFTIGTDSVKGYAYKTAAMSEFYIVRCYLDEKYSYYRYDTADGSFQREPQFKPLTADKKDKESEKIENNSLFARFGRLSRAGKLIILSLALAVLAVAVLIALFVIKIVRNRSIGEAPEQSSFEPISGFDEVTIADAFAQDTAGEVEPKE